MFHSSARNICGELSGSFRFKLNLDKQCGPTSAGTQKLQISQSDTNCRTDPPKRRQCRSITLAVLAITCLGQAACEEAPVPDEVTAEPEGFACIEGGQLTTTLFGSIKASIDWREDIIDCEGMPRPGDNGARLRFSGPHPSGDDTRTLTFILGLPDLKAGQSGKELPTTITLIEEGSGRFFGTPDASGCWTDVISQQLLADSEDSGYRISGAIYCTSPLAELNGNANLSFTELTFTGRLSWVPPK